MPVLREMQIQRLRRSTQRGIPKYVLTTNRMRTKNKQCKYLESCKYSGYAAQRSDVYMQCQYLESCKYSGYAAQRSDLRLNTLTVDATKIAVPAQM